MNTATAHTTPMPTDPMSSFFVRITIAFQPRRPRIAPDADGCKRLFGSLL